jgi:hypothetical protein
MALLATHLKLARETDQRLLRIAETWLDAWTLFQLTA